MWWKLSSERFSPSFSHLFSFFEDLEDTVSRSRPKHTSASAADVFSSRKLQECQRYDKKWVSLFPNLVSFRRIFRLLLRRNQRNDMLLGYVKYIVNRVNKNLVIPPRDWSSNKATAKPQISLLFFFAVGSWEPSLYAVFSAIIFILTLNSTNGEDATWP